jgi:23S rRNA (pseudouridine1915-N3)-methyltransferase
MQRKMRILAVGKIRNRWVEDGVREYLKRIPEVTLIEIKDSTPAKEVAEIQTLLKPQEGVVLLSERGKLCDSLSFAQQLSGWVMAYPIAFVIAGPNGFGQDASTLRPAHQLALSPMTFTHEIARLLLAEQLYRAHSILNQGRYHK